MVYYRPGGLWFCGFADDVGAQFYLGADEGVGDHAAEEHLALFVEVGAVDGGLLVFGALVGVAGGIELVGLLLRHAFEEFGGHGIKVDDGYIFFHADSFGCG